MEKLNCLHQNTCSGCSLLHRPYQEQLQQKKESLLQFSQKLNLTLPPFEIIPIKPTHIRDKIDLTIKNQNGQMVIGFFEKNSREIADISDCSQMSPKLFEWFKIFRSNLPNIKVGSVRLRVSQDNRRAAWLDFANLDVKNLFEEKSWLRWLADQAFIEIGQRRKKLSFVNGQPKLLDPEPQRWFSHYSLVGGFSQVGFEANQGLVNQVLALAKLSGETNWTELFCGSGNFSLALAKSGFSVVASDNDQSALACLEKTINEDQVQNIKVHEVDAYKLNALNELTMDQGLLVDPPRSGLKKLTEHLAALPQTQQPKSIIYVSCNAETFAEDLKKLTDMNYKIKNLVGVDQFPQSEHCEWIALLKGVKGARDF